ncbi:putative NAD kinase 2 [Diplonema papillatum]|nr:putative NAD kinase 2 [Diplonema papillatum]|eukprot:gene9231-14307_t
MYHARKFALRNCKRAIGGQLRASTEAAAEAAAAALAAPGSRRAEVVLGGRVSLEWEDSDPMLRLRRRAMLRWKHSPERILIVKKWKCKRTTAAATFVADWLSRKGCLVLVEAQSVADYGKMKVTPSQCSANEQIDLVVVLGGDGTLLHASRLFSTPNHGPLPPCVTFGLGSLGFMANFSFDKWTGVMDRVLHRDAHLRATLRTRLLAELKDENAGVLHSAKVLNDVVVCQPTGSGGIGKFMLFVDKHSITVVEGDGIIVSTPSGSTGYNMSCGGAMVAPSVPCTLLTPIAPSSLSFRPILINEQSVVDVVLPNKSRMHAAQCVCDGRRIPDLLPGYSVTISTSKFPLPVINLQQKDHDWLDGITEKLLWNRRGASQSDDLEDDPDEDEET